MKLNIKHIAKLANLHLEENQLEKLEGSIENVISYMEEIKSLKVDNIKETSRVTKEENVTDEDIVSPSLTQDEALSNAKHKHNGFFVVPAVFESEE